MLSRKKFISENNDNDYLKKRSLKHLDLVTQDKDGESIGGRHQKFSKRKRNYCPPRVLDVSWFLANEVVKQLVSGEELFWDFADDKDGHQANLDAHHGSIPDFNIEIFLLLFFMKEFVVF